MRIALIGPVYPFRGGIAHYTTMLGRELRQAGHEVLVVSFRRQYPAWAYPGRSDKDPSLEPLTVEGVEYSIDLVNPLTWLQAAAHIRGFRPAVVVMQWWSTVWAPAWRTLAYCLRRAPAPELVFICHNVLPHEQRPWDVWLTRSVLESADRIVVSSKQEKATLLALLPGARAAVVPHPIYDMLADVGMTRQQARAQLGLPADAPVLLHFGLVRPYKGLMTLIEALPLVRAQLPDVRLVIAGEFWEDRNVYEERIRVLGLTECVLIDGRYIPNEEVARYFSATDAVVLPYLHATQSGVAQMALGFGAPVIATRVGGLPETVRDGETGVLVEPKDPLALAGAIVSYLRGERALRRGEGLLGTPDRGWEELVQVVIRGRHAREGVDSDES